MALLNQSVPDSHPACTLPTGSSFDFIPLIHSLFSRLLLDQTDRNALQPKDLPGAVLEIKQKIQRARAVIEELSEIERTVADQEAEIADLEDKIRWQRERITGLGRKLGEDGF